MKDLGTARLVGSCFFGRGIKKCLGSSEEGCMGV